MAQENSGAPDAGAAGGARTIGEDSDQVKQIGALLRGEETPAGSGDDEEKPKAGEGAPGEDAPAGAKPGSEPEPGAGDEGASDDEEAPAGGDDKPVTLSELAKTLGVKEGELFDEVKVDVEVTREDGTKGREAVSLGDLRRGYVAAEKLERERTTFEAEADRRSLEFMQTRAQLEYLGSVIGPNAPREVQERVNQYFVERDTRERALLLEAVPEWKDSAKFTADRTIMIDFLKPWGFSASDVYGIADHRIARFVRDMAREGRRKAEAERKARQGGNGEVKRGQAPDGRVGVTPLRAKLAKIVDAGKAAKTTEGKTSAIGALLRSTVKR